MNYIRNLTPRRTGNSWKTVTEYNSQKRTLRSIEGFCWERVTLAVFYVNVWKIYQCYWQGAARAGLLHEGGWARSQGHPPRPSLIASPEQDGDNEFPRQSQKRRGGDSDPGSIQGVQGGAGEGGGRDRTGDEASTEVQGPSQRQGSGQVHLRYSSGKDRRAKPSGAWMDLLDHREEAAWVEVAQAAARALRTVAAGYVINDLGLEKEVSSKE